MTSLRSTILQHALPLIPTHSFTRHTLSIALSSLPPSHPDYKAQVNDSVIDTIFGAGPSLPAQTLTQTWAEEGLSQMEEGRGDTNIRSRLKHRLGYSAQVGEHLVEAYALMTAPSSTPSIPIPKLPPPLVSYLTSMRLPPLYSPPGTQPSSSPSNPSSSRPNPSSVIQSLLDATNHRLPFLSVNPVGPLSYAFQIANTALLLDEKTKGVVKGLLNEPVGSGPEWYTSRISLMIAYLAAESQLLQSYPAHSPPQLHLDAAEAKLDEHLDRYDQSVKAIQSGEQGLNQVMGFMEYVAKSTLGLIRSRGL